MSGSAYSVDRQSADHTIIYVVLLQQRKKFLQNILVTICNSDEKISPRH